MRKENASFRTAFLSEEGSKLMNKDYFAYVEMESFACYVVADSLDEEKNTNSAEIAVKAILLAFMEHPSVSAAAVKKYLKKAHRQLLSDRGGMRMRASVALVVTDYVKFRYGMVGNSRFMLLRNGRVLFVSKDQSLSGNLLEAEQIPRDKAATHEERNNLYSYLGQLSQKPDWQISGKKKLCHGDTLLLYTRGVWENCKEGELIECAKDASQPQELADRVEDCILGKLREEIENYTIAVTFVDKVYQNPKKWLSPKKILAILIPAVILLIGLGVGLFIRYQIRTKQVGELERHMKKAVTYISYQNFTKAIQEYQMAEELAVSLKKEELQSGIADSLLLLEQIQLADQAMAEGDYDKAGELYQQASQVFQQAGGRAEETFLEQTEDMMRRVLSAQAKDEIEEYLADQIDQTQGYQEFYDLLEAGDRKGSYGNFTGAIELYQQAKEKAAQLLDQEARRQAGEKQLEAEEALERLQQEKMDNLEEQIQETIIEEQAVRELEQQERINNRKNAIELETKGNELMKNGDYLSAIPYFETAMLLYEELDMAERVHSLSLQTQACHTLQEESRQKADLAAGQESTSVSGNSVGTENE